LSHTTKNKVKTLSRVRRIKGQVEAIERALETEGECEEILQLVASCRGALNGLMAELIDGHLRFHVLDPEQKTSRSQLEAADELMAVVKRYLN
jgi:FrmR/RcnR family transcriptional regulator, repressor of frmRAB operon